VDIIAHPSGRLSASATEPTGLELSSSGAETRTILEINAQPARLDLSDLNARRALEWVAAFHWHGRARAGGLDAMFYGVAVAGVLARQRCVTRGRWNAFGWVGTRR